jgi:hypothetical protein
VARGKARPKVATAVARELTGFIWAIARGCTRAVGISAARIRSAWPSGIAGRWRTLGDVMDISATETSVPRARQLRDEPQSGRYPTRGYQQRQPSRERGAADLMALKNEGHDTSVLKTELTTVRSGAVCPLDRTQPYQRPAMSRGASPPTAPSAPSRVGRPVDSGSRGSHRPSPNEFAIKPFACIRVPRFHPVATDQFPVRILRPQTERFDEVPIDDEEVSSIRQ